MQTFFFSLFTPNEAAACLEHFRESKESGVAAAEWGGGNWQGPWSRMALKATVRMVVFPRYATDSIRLVF